MYTAKFPVIVQMVKVSPPDVIIFKRNTDNSTIEEQLEIMWTKNNKNVRFVERISHDVEKTLDILLSVPLLANDFQIMVDRHSGAIYHFDFDRFVAGIFNPKFGETFPNKHATTIQTMKGALDWAKNKSMAQGQYELDNISVNQAKNGDVPNLGYEKSNAANCSAEAAIYVDSHFRWKGRKIHNLARIMLVDYVQKRWHYMHLNDNMNRCPSMLTVHGQATGDNELDILSRKSDYIN